MTSGNPIVDQMAEIQITGNITPPQWYRTITYPSGKPYLTAIIILSDVVYWYRPQYVRDEGTGQLKEVKKKFRSDLLQRSYGQISEQFGFSKREATNAIIALEKLGVLRRVFRTLKKDGLVMSNVLFLELNPERLKELTFRCEATPITSESDTPENDEPEQVSDFECIDLSLSEGTPPHAQSETNTKTSSKTSSEISSSEESKKGAPASPSPRQTFDEIIDDFTINDELRKLLRAWLQVRYRQHKPLTSDSLKIALNRLLKAADNNIEQMVELVESAVVNGWTDFKARPSYMNNGNTPTQGGKRVSAHNYTQRQYTDEELNALLADVSKLDDCG